MMDKRRHPILLAIALMLVLLACKKKKVPKPTKPYVRTVTYVGGYKEICKTAGTKLNGTPYEKKADRVSPIVVFQKYLDNKKPAYSHAARRCCTWSNISIPRALSVHDSYEVRTCRCAGAFRQAQTLRSFARFWKSSPPPPLICD